VDLCFLSCFGNKAIAGRRQQDTAWMQTRLLRGASQSVVQCNALWRTMRSAGALNGRSPALGKSFVGSEVGCQVG
jgi:hypothetical protein